MGITEPALYRRALGERIRHYRQLRGLRQHELGRLAGRCQASVCGWENGTRSPTLGVLHRIAAALDVDVVDLLGGDQEAARRRTRQRPPAGGAPVINDPEPGRREFATR